jgi:predicted nuclease with TOPRIM domain
MGCDLQRITLLNNEYLKQIKDLHDEKEELRVRLSSRQSDLVTVNVQKLHQREVFQRERAKKLRNEVDQLNLKLKKLRKSTTFQAGVAFREAMKQPVSKGPLLPWRLIKLFREKGRKSQY